jgi:DNA replication protein
MPERQLLGSQTETGFVALPELFFTRVMPEIQDVVELKLVLYVSYLILRKQEHPCFVTYKELRAESHRLSAGLDEDGLRQALDSAILHGALLHSTSNINGISEDVYSLPFASQRPSTVNIFALYEQNIGLITPIIAEELKEAERIYPPGWIEDAFKEAVALNKRSWRYIARILERWGTEGKDSGEYRRRVKEIDPDKYIKGKYGHLVKR